MARVFTTQFQFNQQIYHAIVTTKVIAGKMSFTIKLQDVDLHDIIPNGTIEYDEDGNIQEELLENNMAVTIIDCVTQAVSSHLKKVPQHSLEKI